MREETDAIFFGDGAVAVLAKNIIAVVGQFGGRKPRHILHDAEDWHIDFVIAEHIDALDNIGDSHLLRRGYDDCATEFKGLNHCEMYVARTGGQVKQQVVQFAPIAIVDDLIEEVGRHRTAPNCGAVGIDEKSHRQHLDTVFFGGNNQIPAVLRLSAKRLVTFETKHFWHRGSKNIGVNQSHFVAQLCEGDGEICGNSALAHSTFARRHSDDVLDLGERFGFVVFGCLNILHVGLHIDFGVDLGVDDAPDCLANRIEDWLHGIVDFEEHLDTVVANLHPVHDARRHNILAALRVDNQFQRLNNILFCHNLLIFCAPKIVIFFEMGKRGRGKNIEGTRQCHIPTAFFVWTRHATSLQRFCRTRHATSLRRIN